MNLNPPKYLLIKRIRYLVIVVVLILYVTSANLVETGQFAISKLHFILKNPILSYHEKMSLKWGTEYDLLRFVKDNTSPTAVIVAPFRVRPWNILANGQLFPYFLYPRKHKKADVKKIEADKTITHVMIAWGSWWGSPESFYGWPKFPVNARKFSHLPTERTVSVDGLRVEPEPSRERFSYPAQLLENSISDSEKEVNYHGMIRSSEAHQVESIHLTYTSSNYDYWMKMIEVPLVRGTVVKGRVAAGIKRSVDLVAEVKYGNGKSSVFCSPPNENVGNWENLSIEDLYRKAERYARARGWKTKKMWISRIGVNTGRPSGMPYLEKYGLIEVERGQNGMPESADLKLETAPVFLAQGNFLRAKNEMSKATGAYELAALLDPANAWIHSNLGDMYQEAGEIGKAIKEYQEAIELEPDVAWFYFALGQVHKEEGNKDLAIKYLNKCVELDPSAVWAHVALGDLYRDRKAGSPYRHKEAYEHFKAGSRFGIHSAYSKYALQMCRKYERAGPDRWLLIHRG